MNYPFSRALPCAGLITLLSASVQALELQTVAYAGAMYSDNATSLKQQRRHDVRNTVGLEAQLTEQRQRVEGDISVSMENERYMRDSSRERSSITSGLGMLNLDLVEDVLHWETSFTRAQVLEDATQESSLEDRNYRNTLRSGPQMSVELTDTTDLEGYAHYVNVENSDEVVSDSERANVSMALLHHYNQLTQFNLSSRYETILNEDEMDPFDRKSGSIGVTRTLARGSLSLNVGRTSLVPELGESVDSNFYQVSFRHDEFLYHILQVGYTQDVSDTSIGFIDESLVEADTGELPDNDYVTRKRWSASLSRTIGVHSYSVSGARSDSRYELSGQQVILNTGAFRYERPVIEHLVAGASLSYTQRNYVSDPTAGINKTLVYAIDANYQFSERLDLGSYMQLISRDTTGTQGNDYEEFQLGIDLRYRLF